MQPVGDVPGRKLTKRHARLAVAGVLGILVLGLLALVVENALVLHRIHRINENGGMVYSYAERLPLWSPWPRPVREWLDDHYVLRADYTIDFNEGPGCGTGITLMFPPSRRADPGDEGLAAVRDLGRVRRLYLTNTSVSDAGLRMLRDLGSIEHLVLDGTAVSDTGLDDLARMPALESISLCGTRVTDEAARRSPSEAIRRWEARRRISCAGREPQPGP